MAIPMKLLMIFALSSLFIISAAFAISDSPFIVAHKKATLTKLDSGAEHVSVSIDIYNRGSAAAYDVNFTDNSWAQEVFELVGGNTTKTWERLVAVKAMYYGTPAAITFRIPMKSKLQAYPTPILPLDILADRIPAKKLELVKRFFAEYGSLISVICIVVLSGHLIASPSKSNDAKGSKKS
ncbi:uncharacterized protein LOC114285734 isoform X3 [Camellia sinensis]|uniref:uncharacterized protein LOC114285734 isoform X3 n=1 Tax=Camellia sinensis TaxID=4442 RepID=UPI0010357140|nr:uncharacterized protein LOC114285734 isoform X3 [Camellia sinensis]